MAGTTLSPYPVKRGPSWWALGRFVPGITLSESDVRWALDVGRQRDTLAKQQGFRPKRGEAGTDIAHQYGALGECAFARWWGVRWRPVIGKSDDGTDVGPCGVRAIRRSDGWLIVRDDDDPGIPQVAAVYEANTDWRCWRFPGWLVGGEAPKVGIRARPDPKLEPAWCVALDQLRPIETLPAPELWGVPAADLLARDPAPPRAVVSEVFGLDVRYANESGWLETVDPFTRETVWMLKSACPGWMRGRALADLDRRKPGWRAESDRRKLAEAELRAKVAPVRAPKADAAPSGAGTRWAYAAPIRGHYCRDESHWPKDWIEAAGGRRVCGECWPESRGFDLPVPEKKKAKAGA